MRLVFHSPSHEMVENAGFSLPTEPSISRVGVARVSGPSLAAATWLSSWLPPPPHQTNPKLLPLLLLLLLFLLLLLQSTR